MRKPILCIQDLTDAIRTYNPKIDTLRLLHTFFEHGASLEDRQQFFDHTLPKMQKMMLNMPNVVTTPPRLLLRDNAESIYLTQEQCAHILVAAFFCTFPRRNKSYKNEYDVSFQFVFGIENNIFLSTSMPSILIVYLKTPIAQRKKNYKPY